MSAPDSSEVLRPEDLSPSYIADVTVKAWAVAQRLARTYEPAYASGLTFDRLPPVTLSAEDALTLAQFVGVTVCMFEGEL